MKKIIFVLTTLCAIAGCSNAQQTFNVFTYTEPKGFTKEISTGNVSYTLMDNKKGTYCMINLLGAVNSSGDIQTEFNTEWNKNVAAKNKMIDVLQMDVPKKVNGWDAITGGQNFTLGKKPTMALLTTFVGFGKKANVLIYMNDDSYLKYATEFLQKISLNKPQVVVKQQNNNTTTTPIVNNNTIDNDYKNANETTGTGAVSDYNFVLPNDWTVQNNPNEIVLEPKDRGSFTPIVSMMPFMRGSGNLETDMNTFYFQLFAGWQESSNNWESSRYYEKGKTIQGFPYYMQRMKIMKTVNGEIIHMESGVLIIQLQGRVAMLAVANPTSLFCLTEFGYLLFSLRFNNEKSLPNSLSQDLLGGWCITGSSASSCNTYYKDGSFAKGGATSTRTSHDANYDKVTTSSFGASGTYSIKGGILSAYYKSNGVTYKDKIRFYYKKNGNKDWEFKMGSTSDEEYGTKLRLPGEWDRN
jgi:hypothetical protein